MSNFDIDDYFKGREGFGGVYANNELKKPKPNTVYILNLQNLGEGGSHWTLLYNGWYMDSYGVGPTKAISKFVKTWNKDQYQGYHKESCGYFAIYVAENILNGLDPLRNLIPLEFSQNENTLKKYFVE